MPVATLTSGMPLVVGAHSVMPAGLPLGSAVRPSCDERGVVAVA